MTGKFPKKCVSIIVLTFFILSIYSLSAECVYAPAAINPIFQKGMSYVTWTKDGFMGKRSDESLQSMAESGINYVAVIPTWYQEDFDSTEIKATDRTPSDESIRHVIRKAHALRMAVLLKPHIDLIHNDGYSRGDIGFQTEEKWYAWLASYQKFITHYARIAQEERVQIFCIGTELTFASSRTEMWHNNIIPKVRNIYTGKITYAANWDEYKGVEFWADLDYAGIDAYFPLCTKIDPTYEDIKEGWASWLANLEKWQADIDKPVIFTECGYCSADSAPKKPWEEAFGGKANMEMQAYCYRAVFETFWDKSWFYGVYWWNWNTYPQSGGESNRGFTPQNKLALNYIKEWYSKPVDTAFRLAKKPQDASAEEIDNRIAVASAMRAANKKNVPITGELADRPRSMYKQQ